MGIFKDFAASGYGDFTMGALTGLAEQGVADARKNEMFAIDAANKENDAFRLTELRFKNKKEISNIIANNPLEFGISATANMNISQTADALTNKILREQPSIFEFNDMSKVKMGVAKYLTSDLSKKIQITTPYTPSEDLFKAEQEKHSAKLSEISKMPRVDKLLMNIKEAEESIATPEAITDSLTKVASISAKGYGILNTFPGTQIGDTNLKFAQTNIIVANAKREFPNDANQRAQFIEKKLFDNNINPLQALNFNNPVTFKGMSKVLDAQGNALASKISELTNAMAQAADDEGRVQIQNQINQVIMQQYALINTYSGSVSYAIGGKDADKIGSMEQASPPVEETPAVEDEETPGLFKRKTKPPKTLKEILPDIRGGEPEDTGLDAFQASFKLNSIDRPYIVNQWSEKYQGEGKFTDKARANKDLMLGSFDIPGDAASDINDVADIFDGDNNFNKDQIAEILGAIGFFESKYKTKVQGGDGPARSYWQVEPKTAKSILAENLGAMQTGRKQFLGPKFEALFKNKYKDVIGNKTALEYFASLNEDQLRDLLLKDGAFAASMAAHKVITTFDPYSSKEEIEV
tara:strand:- start:3 stop:1742 length:1740 start_codon:yes stop_codon:yes gene_type:complete